MKPVELDPEAAEELQEAINYLETSRPGSGEEFEQTVRAALDVIGKQPKAFSPYRGRYRKNVIKKFGYSIFYVEFDDRVWVAAFAHGKRRPDYWINREPK
jgi:toxin ParE1/3/4